MLSSSSTVTASARVKFPVLVRTRDDITAPQPSFFPISAHSVLMYVPFEQTTRILYVSSETFSGVREYISTSRASLSTSPPSLAISTSFRPPTFIAEYIGGTCIIFPTNERQTSSTSFSGGILSLVVRTSPVMSSVSVVSPSFISATYSLSCIMR